MSIFKNTFTTFIKQHKIWSVVLLLLIILLLYMGFTGTLSYPFIMIDRQIQSISDCTFGSNNFTTDTYGFSFSVPEGYCVLPNRLFPLDGSVEIVPKGWYFVFNEYAKGTIANSSQATLLFEPITDKRDLELIIRTLEAGRFLSMSNVSSTTSSSGIIFISADNVLGADNQLYDWVFTIHPNKKFFLEIITRHLADKTVLKYFLENLSFI
jgi:hypothetical protein